MNLPKAVDQLVGELSKLPGVGRRSAERLALHLAVGPSERLQSLADALHAVRQSVSACELCGALREGDACGFCSDPSRDASTIVVVERSLDVIAMEKSAGFRGLYHVLGGLLSPLRGVAPSMLRLAELGERLADEEVRELVLATPPTVEGDATSLYISRQFSREGLAMTRLGRGVPQGGSLEHADAGTLRMALQGRQRVEP